MAFKNALWALSLTAAAQGARVKYVFFLEMENRSFDHMLGFSNITGLRGLTGNESNPMNPNDPTSPVVTVSPDGAYVDPDPGHGVADTAQQMYGNTWNMTRIQMNGFVANAVNNTGASWAPNIMKMMSPSHVPVITTLAQQFAVADNYHAGVPGPTFPNRLYSISATSHGFGDNDPVQTVLGWPQKSIFGALDDINVPYRVYFSEAPTAWLMQDTRDISTWPGRYKFIESFFTDIAKGDAAPFTMLDPGYFSIPGLYNATDQHPSHSVADGELFYKSVYEALRASPIWNESVLILTYDEHGGFADFVAPPAAPSPDGIACTDCGVPFDFTRVGVRVPALFISPWIPAGTVVHGAPPAWQPTPASVMEHSSIPATVRAVFGTKAFLTARDTWAPPLHWIWEQSNLTAPRTDCPTVLPTPPPTPAFIGRAPSAFDPLSHLQKDLLYMVHGALNGATTREEADALTAAAGIATEEDAARYIRSLVAPLLQAKAA